MGVTGGVGEHSEEVGLTDVIRAGTADQDSAGAKHLQSAKVEFFVAAHGWVEVALGFGKGGRVENDGVVALAGGGIVLEQVEGAGFHPLDVQLIESGVTIGDLESRARAVDSGDMATGPPQMKGKAPRMADTGECISPCIL